MDEIDVVNYNRFFDKQDPLDVIANNLLLGDTGLMGVFREHGVGGPQAKLAKEAYNNGVDAYNRGDFRAAKNFWEQTLSLEPAYLQAQSSLDKLKNEHPEIK